MLWEEVIKLLRFSKTAEDINIKREELAAWMPAIRVMFDYDQNSQYHPYDLWMHCVHTVLGIVAATTVMIIPRYHATVSEILINIVCVGIGAIVSYEFTLACRRLRENFAEENTD